MSALGMNQENILIKEYLNCIREEANKIGNYSGYCKEKINILNNVRKVEQLLGIKREGD